MTKLLNIDANPKTIKGQKLNYMTAVMYLAPWKASGYNVCAMADVAGCAAGCLNTAGRGGIAKGQFAPFGVALPENTIQKARLWRTRLFIEDREAFLAMLTKEIDAFIRKAKRKGFTPAIRLNGTSDIQWERVAPWLFEKYADVQFYDYTKIAKRFERALPANYHLSLSYSEASATYAATCWNAFHKFGASLVMVIRDAKTKADHAARFSNAFVTVDGDEHDLRFIDPKASLVLLKAKGSARRDVSGFVLG